MEQKSFFRRRSVSDISRLHNKRLFSEKDLICRIADIDPSSDSLELRMQLIPGRFYRHASNGHEASLKCLHHGEYIWMSQPRTPSEAYRCTDIPLQIRKNDMTKNLEGRRETDIHSIGIGWYPVQGPERIPRIISFASCTEGLKIYAYSERLSQGIEVNLEYVSSKRVKNEGGLVLCKVPSRTRRERRYQIDLLHIPIESNTEKRAVIYSLRPKYTGSEPEFGRHNIRYTYQEDANFSDRVDFQPQEVAAYIATAGKLWRQYKKIAAMEMNPFPLFSEKGCEIYKKLQNNVVIFDPSIKRKDHLRWLNLSEINILLARAISVLGHDTIAFWDWESGRDRILKNYDWSIK
ncbi:MAG: hypothetical protein ABIF10_07720 [Candidatus Woesearchaeota archaeon]